MNSYPTEIDLLAALDRSDDLVRECAAGHVSFAEFCAEYDNFYWSFALDGHESDQAGQAVLARYAARIALHQTVAETILAKACSDADAANESYRAAGRFGSTEAVSRLKLVVAGLSGGEA
ncbi:MULTISPECIES: hypothetical protein [unclassified Pseudoxanthomonas]|uniref:hypothetical protein n=1 Tax=unclassified Pseudoxanthomonas TaxID=2645906 RepID=UPI0008E452B8|nr:MULTISPECIES: hypothetical protein [unclassified Pseudoxanthomonas]PPJ42859.1 hypothetical protein C0063_06315 [Pseudoxanthomonas sp. KAs_5_3]SFV33485.1 hypothetical protein SAMN05428990_2334 [Pseudoxanthomonas sp. YR558]